MSIDARHSCSEKQYLPESENHRSLRSAFRSPVGAKRIVLGFVLLLSLLLPHGPVVAANFAKNYGGSFGSVVVTSGTAVDSAGNVYSTGFFVGRTLMLGSMTLTRIGAKDAYVAKLDASGHVIWARNFGGSGAEAAGTEIAVDGSGNVYLGGSFKLANLTSPALTKIGVQDAFAIKLDASGATAWARNFGGTFASATGNAIAVDGSGNVYAAGYSSGNLTTPALTLIGGQDVFAIKLDTSGTTVWARNFGGSGAFASANAIAADGAGNVYLSGYSSGNLTTPALTSIGYFDAFALKLDASGATTWARNFGGSFASAAGDAIAVDSSGNVYMGGELSGSLTTPALTTIGIKDAFAIKLDTSGATVWARNFGGSDAFASGIAIAADGAGNVYLSGYFSGNLTTPALTSIGYSDAFALKLDASGTTTWAKNFGGSGASAAGNAIAVDGSGNVYLGGSLNGANITIPALIPLVFQDAFALKLDASGATTWASGYGSLSPGGNSQIDAMATDASGNVYIAGSFSGYTLDLGSVTLTKIGFQDAFVSKLDANGNVILARNFGGSTAVAHRLTIAVDGAGNVYLGGSFSGILTTPALTTIGNIDAFAIKLDPSGAITWAKNFGGVNGAIASGNAIAVDGAGNVYLGGHIGGDLSTPALAQIGFLDAFVIKLDASGATTWAKNFGGSGAFASSTAITADGAGNVYVGGDFSTANLTAPVLTLIGLGDAFAFKLDAGGATTWAKNFGGSSAVASATAIATDGAGNVYLGGYFNLNLTTPALTKIGSGDAFAFKLDPSGATTWAKNFGGSGVNAFGNTIAVDSAGSVYLGGDFQFANLTTPALTKIGFWDAFAFKLDASGATTWAKNFGGSNATANGTAIAVDSVGNVYLGGRFESANLTTPALTKIGDADAFVLNLSYGVIYNDNGSTGGSVPVDLNGYETGSTVAVLGAGSLVKTGYAFAGWNTAANGSGTPYPGGATFAIGSANVTLYAQWVSSNANLSNLTISAGSLSPAFGSGTTGYTDSVTNATSSVTVTPTAADATATIKVNGNSVTSGSASGALDLVLGSGNVIAIVVTAQDGTSTKTYTVTVTRAPSANAFLSSLAISTGSLAPAFASGSFAYTDAVTNATSSLTITPTAADATAAITVNGGTIISGSASGMIALAVGSGNVITVVVTAQDGTTINTYAITVTRAASTIVDLAVSMSHSGNFARGHDGATYTIAVSNVGGVATDGSVVSVTDTLPVGLTATALGGSGWTCVLGTLTCTRWDALIGGASYPALTLTVNVAGNAPGRVVNSATVIGGGDANAANNTVTDGTSTVPAVPAILYLLLE